MKRHTYYFRDKIYKISKSLVRARNYKVLIKNTLINKTLRQKIMFNSYKISFKVNKNNIRKFCMFTGRLRSTVHNVKLNRLNFRELVSKNSIPGVFKR